MTPIADMTTDQKVVAYVAATSTLVEKAAAQQKAASETRAKCASLIPGVVAKLAEFSRIEPGQEADMARALEDPAKALLVIEKLAGHRNRTEAAEDSLRMGGPANNGGPVKRASHDPIGSRRPVAERESDVAFMKALGF
jgi:hypothetical protein